MSKGRRHRGSKRAGFEEDIYSMGEIGGFRPDWPLPESPPRHASHGDEPPVEATVKWFNESKGFGFVELAGGEGDAFLHIAVLQAAGHGAVPVGARLKVRFEQGQKGRKVAAVLEVDTAAAASAPARPPRRGPFQGPENSAPTIEIEGTVKWFSPAKGFGFIDAGDGAKDVFIHITVVQRAGLASLSEGQRVRMRVVMGQKGREAASIDAGPEIARDEDR